MSTTSLATCFFVEDLLDVDNFTSPIFCISTLVKLCLNPFLTLYPFRLFFLKTKTLSDFKCSTILAVTPTPLSVGTPTSILPSLSNNKTLSKIIFDPSLLLILLTNNSCFSLTLNCCPAISTIAYI